MLLGPDIVPGVFGVNFNANDLRPLLEQELFAFTEIDPEEKAEDIFTVNVVPAVVIGEAPSAEVIPVGKIQV